jgi:hypothetical protein
MHMMAEENGDATWLKSTFKLMISQLRCCWKLAEVAGARGLMRRPAEVAGVGGRPLLCDRSPSTASGVAARAEGAPDSGGAARELLKAGTAGGGAQLVLRSWRACLLYWRYCLLCSRRRPAGGGARPDPARAQLRRELRRELSYSDGSVPSPILIFRF